MGYRELSPELQTVAERELNEDPQRRDQDIQHIRDWLAKQPHITARTDDQWLLSFLRGCKFSLEKTKRKLDTYYAMRGALPEFFSDRDPLRPAIQSVLRAGSVTGLPGPDLCGRRVLVVRPGRMEASRAGVEAGFSASFLLTDAMLLTDDRAVVLGTCSVIDLAGVTLAHAAPLTPWFVKRVLTCMQDAYPVRPQAMHYVNAPPSYETVMNLFQAFMSDKLRKRVHVHSSYDSLLDFFPRESLPSDYGGQGPSVDEAAALWKNRLEDLRPFFKEDSKYGIDESKRPGKPKTDVDLFGMEGSFRQLNVD